MLLRSGSQGLKAEIAFRNGRFQFEIQGGARSEAPAVSFGEDDWLYLVANYDYPGHLFCLFVNGQAGSADRSQRKQPELDWAGDPFKIYAGSTPRKNKGDMTLTRLRTGNRPLSGQEITANLASLRSTRDLHPGQGTLLDVGFEGGPRMRRGYGELGFLSSTKSAAAVSPTPLPRLDSVPGPRTAPASWVVSDTNWKAHPGGLSDSRWTENEFDDRNWNAAVIKIDQTERKLGAAYVYNSKPHHLDTSSGQWIGFGSGREGSLRRTFVLSPHDIDVLKKQPGTLYITAAEKFDCFVNGRRVAGNGAHFRPGYGGVPQTTTYWQVPQTFNIASLLYAGRNSIAVRLQHDARISTDERAGLFLDWRKGPFEDVRIGWSSVPGETIMRPATLDLREAALRSMEYHFNTDFKSVLVAKGGIFWGWSYGDTLGRSLDATALLRSMTGVNLFPDVDRRLMEVTLQTFTHPDRLSYRELAPHVPPELEIPGSVPYACMWDQAEVLFGLVTWYEKTRSPVIRDYIEGMIAGLQRAAIREGEAYHIPEEFWDGRQWVSSVSWFNPGAVLLDPIAHYVEISHSPAAYELLRGLYRAQKEHLGHDGRHEAYFDEVFRLKTQRISSEGQYSQNFGAGVSLGWTGALRAAFVLQDREMIDWVQRALDWSIGIAATRYGHALEGLGYLPGEICGAADLVEMASMLAERVDSRYWGLVERFIRNHITQTQESQSGMWGRVTPEGSLTSPLPCCSSRGARALYIAWHHTVRRKPEGVFVNLALNRDSPWLEVESYLPYQGRIELRIHNAPVVFVRIPEWAPHEQVQVECDGARLPAPAWQGEYIRLTGLRKGQRVSVGFPVQNTKTVEELRLGKDALPVRYQASWRGYTLVRLTPGGKYDRSAMTTAVAPVRPVKAYFVPESEIDW